MTMARFGPNLSAWPERADDFSYPCGGCFVVSQAVGSI
jgi:hypothetical protein